MRQCHTLEVAGTALGCLGLCGWMADEPEWYDRYSNFGRWRNGWRIAGWMLQISGLLVMWLGALPCLVQITWQVAVCSLPAICLFLFFVFVAWTEGVRRYIDEKELIFITHSLLYFMALPLSGMWQWFTGLELAAYLYLCIGVCNWIWFDKKRQEDPGRVRCCDLQVFFRCFAGL